MDINWGPKESPWQPISMLLVQAALYEANCERILDKFLVIKATLEPVSHTRQTFPKPFTAELSGRTRKKGTSLPISATLTSSLACDRQLKYKLWPSFLVFVAQASFHSREKF